MIKAVADGAKLALGLMSGTSLDGIDAALITTDGNRILDIGPSLTTPYTAMFRNRLRLVLGRKPEGPEALSVAAELTRLHAGAVEQLLIHAALDRQAVDVIGFHGHTVMHLPDEGVTHQIGDGALLADLTGIPVVADFRQADMVAGGQGAPLAPLFHRALAKSFDLPVAVLNLGGVGNVTYIGKDGFILAFDTGPGNALIDDWMLAHTGKAFDEGGALARMGQINAGRLQALLAHPYFDRLPPKSLDRLDFSLEAVKGLGAADGAATLTEFSAAAVARAITFLPALPLRWLVVGGGRHNDVLMAALGRLLNAPVVGADSVGWTVDAIEAQAFGFLAVRSLSGMPLSLPSTTGVRQPTTGGRLYPARNRIAV
jgi:anhydro-N-acetylmuramic acid kinase